MKIEHKPTRAKYSVKEARKFLSDHQRGRAPETRQMILPGWTDLLVRFIRRLEEHDPSMFVTRVRSKHGGMTVYVDHGDAEVYRMIFELEYVSRFTCEECGRKGRFTPLGHVGTAQTLCARDFRRQLKKYGVRVPFGFSVFRNGSAKSSI